MAFDFSAVSAPFRMQPGLRRLAPDATQLTPLRDGDRVLLEKLQVLSVHASQALVCMPGFDAAPAQAALCRHGAAEHPAAFSWDGTTAAAHHLGWAVAHDTLLPLAGARPEIGRCLSELPGGWRIAGLLALAFAEDFAIVDADSGCVPWMAVCLPSRWAPQAKVGRHFSVIHAPVADNAVLLAAGGHLLRLVTAPGRWERFVWTITPHAGLDSHPGRVAHAAWSNAASPTELAALAHWRTERQTFIPLPESRQAVFTIHVDVQPLEQALADSAQAAQVRDALASMSPAVLAYRGLTPARDRLLAWLNAQASGR